MSGTEEVAGIPERLLLSNEVVENLEGRAFVKKPENCTPGAIASWRRGEAWESIFVGAESESLFAEAPFAGFTRADRRAFVVLIAVVVTMGCERQEPQPEEVTRSNPLVPLDSGLVQIQTADATIRLSVEIAETPEQQRTGLMERRALPDDEAMLFVYEQEQSPSDPFYMFRTRIPLDIAFMDSTGQVVAIRQMEPCTSPEPQWCERYPPGVPYHAALEVNLGFLKEQGIEIGDRVRLVERFGS